MIDVLIIGSGFAGKEIAATLTRNGVSNFEVVDLSESFSMEPVIDFDWSENSIFNSDQANLTAGLGGGVDVWGGAITIPSAANIYFEAEGAWARTGEKLGPLAQPREYFPFYRKPRWNKVLEARFALNRGLKSPTKVRLDCGHYSSPVRRGLGPIKGTKSSLTHFPESRGTLISIDLTEDGIVSLDINCKHQGTRSINSRYVVLASGTFLNAAIVSLLTGKKRFPLGNHPSKTVATVTFPRFRWLGPLPQELRPGDREFFTIHLAGDHAKSIGVNQSSLRIVPVSPLSSSSIAHKDILNRLLHKLRFYKSVQFREILAQEPRDSNYMEVREFVDGRFRVFIHLEIDGGDQLTSETLLNEVLKARIFRSSSVSKVTEDWSDAAHYFGTLAPEIGTDPKTTGEFTLVGAPNVFVCGLSSVKRLTYIHPTLHVVSQARYIGQELVKKVFEENGR
jgi:hypothetical protein